MTQPVGKITVSFSSNRAHGYKKRISNLYEEQVVHDVLSPVRRTWSPANERDNPLKRKRQSGGSQAAWRSGQRRKKRRTTWKKEGRKKAKKKRNDKTEEDKREKERTRHYENEGWDGTTKKTRRIIKRQGGKITHGAALASIHAFYSLAVIARTGRPTSYHLVSPAQAHNYSSSHSWPFSLLILL